MYLQTKRDPTPFSAPHHPSRRIGSRAFTLIEVVVATAIVGIFFVALYAGITQGFTIMANTRENVRATQILLDRMEELRLYSWDQIKSNGGTNSYVPATFTESFYPASTNQSQSTFQSGSTNSSGDFTFYGTIVITNAGLSASYNTNMRRVIVTLNWTNGTTVRQQRMSTLVSQYGLQKYIY